MEKLKLYEVNGVLEYAHCFRKEVRAKNAKEAQKMVKDNLYKLSDPADAEFQGGIADLGVEIEELNSEKEVKTCSTKHVIPPKSKDSGILPNFI